MELKNYQRRVVDEVELYLRAVASERQPGAKHAALDAWESLRRPLGLGQYRERKNGLNEDLPTFCIKVPTGGGKTLLATQILGSIYRTILKDRNGAGLVLWVVPSSQIYRDTLRRLRDRNDMYRLMLEHAVSRRLEVWEKHEITRLSPARLNDCLNILIVQLASTNRETKDQLKFFKDSGGNIVDHFPPENDPEAHARLKQEVANLDMLVDDAERRQHLIATSVGNLVKLCRPAVILDEGHKATSALARATIEQFNASAVVELSATPQREANVLSRVSGQELLAEQMIKLPLNIATSASKSWQDVLTQARDKRERLAEVSREYFEQANETRMIRPIVLVQVERTGRDQRGPDYIHAEDVREYLTQRLDVPDLAIRIKSAQNDGLEDMDLMDPGCEVQWIITKSALQEGWDCPFAYILVSLNNTGSAVAMTQLVGRILRQPHQERTAFDELNESYVYCLRTTAGEIAAQVKGALEKEGYEGEVASLIKDESAAAAPREIVLNIRPQFKKLYTRPFEGKVYLPRFCVKHEERSGTVYRPLDYFDHLVREVDVERFDYSRTSGWRLQEEMKAARDRFFRFQLGTGLEREYETEIDLCESDGRVKAWLASNLKFEFLSQKQLQVIVARAYDRLLIHEALLKDRLATVKFIVRDKLQKFIEDQLDLQTKTAFERLLDAGRIQFYLECEHCRFEVPASVRLDFRGRFTPLLHDNGQQVQKSLFDQVESESHNEYERAVALVLDRDEQVLWWYRNRVGPENFTIQGPRRHKIYPDFVVQGEYQGRTFHRVWVVESKGKHLQGNPDTQYKRDVAAYFDQAGKQVTWQQLGEDFKDHVFRFQVLDEARDFGRDWKDELHDMLCG
jgi:type III restriction enzyme